jgi:hypothetical protein
MGTRQTIFALLEAATGPARKQERRLRRMAGIPVVGNDPQAQCRMAKVDDMTTAD